jgi:hypothetical protein
MRTTKIWVAAVAAIVASVIGAAAAQAAVFTVPSAEYPAFVSGGPTESGPVTLGFEGGQTASCKTPSLAGAIFEATSELSLSPGFGGCTVFGSEEGSIEVASCEFVFHPGSGSVDKFTGTFDIVCPTGEAITVKGNECEVQIGSQTGLGPVAYDEVTENPKEPEEPAKVKASFEMKAASGFAYNKTVDGASCPLSGTGTKADGVFTGSMDLKAGTFEFQPIDFGIE